MELAMIEFLQGQITELKELYETQSVLETPHNKRNKYTTDDNISFNHINGQTTSLTEALRLLKHKENQLQIADQELEEHKKNAELAKSVIHNLQTQLQVVTLSHEKTLEALSHTQILLDQTQRRCDTVSNQMRLDRSKSLLSPTSPPPGLQSPIEERNLSRYRSLADELQNATNLSVTDKYEQEKKRLGQALGDERKALATVRQKLVDELWNQSLYRVAKDEQPTTTTNNADTNAKKLTLLREVEALFSS